MSKGLMAPSIMFSATGVIASIKRTISNHFFMSAYLLKSLHHLSSRGTV